MTRGENKNRHTQGPWKWKSARTQQHLAGADGCYIGVTCDIPNTDQKAANAHLIAAAPDMLDALRAILEAHTDEGEFATITAEHGMRELVAMAAAAIAKATGGAS